MQRLLTVALIVACVTRPAAQAPQAPPAAASGTWTLRDWSRLEMWRFFEPPAGGGNHEYAFGANRMFAGVQRTDRAFDLTAALQYVHFAGLPANVVGPGPLGTGAVY